MIVEVCLQRLYNQYMISTEKKQQQFLSLALKGAKPFTDWQLKTQAKILRGSSRWRHPELHNLPLKSINKELEEQITGFWEGDGTLSRRKRLVISFSQRTPDVLYQTQEVLEAGTVWYTRKRNMHCFSLCGDQALNLLKLLSKHVVCPQRVEQLNKILKKLNLPRTQMHLPTPNWFIGFWDAEGCSHTNSNWKSSCLISVAQKDKRPLQAIREMFGFGHVYPSQFAWEVNTYDEENFTRVANLLLEKSLNEPKKRKLEEDMTQRHNNQKFYQLYKELECANISY